MYRFKTDKYSPVIIDCGANIGLSVIYLKKTYPFAKLICFEPDPQNAQVLEKNIKDNQLTDVNINKKAVWITDGYISFESKGSEASQIDESGDSKGVKVACIDFIKVINNYDVIDFLKMDIEGVEFEVITHCRDFLGRINNMFIEYHGKVSDTAKLTELLNIFKEHGFDVYIKNAADNLKMPFLEKKTGIGVDVQLNIFCYKNN